MNSKAPSASTSKTSCARTASGPPPFHTIAWAQYRPQDGARFRAAREQLARSAAKLIPFVTQGRQVKGLRKMRFKLRRALVPHTVLSPAEWNAKIVPQLR